MQFSEYFRGPQGPNSIIQLPQDPSLSSLLAQLWACHCKQTVLRGRILHARRRHMPCCKPESQVGASPTWGPRASQQSLTPCHYDAQPARDGLAVVWLPFPLQTLFNTAIVHSFSSAGPVRQSQTGCPAVCRRQQPKCFVIMGLCRTGGSLVPGECLPLPTSGSSARVPRRTGKLASLSQKAGWP